jgi:hypothetical protein
MADTQHQQPQQQEQHYTALAALHAHYRTLILSERETIVQERRLWEEERALYLRRIKGLEERVLKGPAAASTEKEVPPPPSPPPSGPPRQEQQQRRRQGEEGKEEEEEEEEGKPEMSPPEPIPPYEEKSVPGYQENPAVDGAVDEDEDDEDEEITDIEMSQLIREAARIVYPNMRARPKGRSVVSTPPRAGDGGEDEEDDEGEGAGRGAPEVVELKLKKTMNFGAEFGRAWR